MTPFPAEIYSPPMYGGINKWVAAGGNLLIKRIVTRPFKTKDEDHSFLALTKKGRDFYPALLF